MCAQGLVDWTLLYDDDDDDDDDDGDDDDDLFSLLFDISSRFVLYNNVLTIFN